MRNQKTTFWVFAGLLGLFALVTAPAAHGQVFTSDVIIQGSACVGFDCVNGESFGFDTLRLKENNLRINFNDTSTSASFPTNDWRIIANDSSNGGSEYLGIEDSSAGNFPFRVFAGAGANALVVDSQGDVGIGVLSPVVDLHVKSGNTPTLRLEQDGSSGFASQTWDVAGNEVNFFIRDVTSGSKLPIRSRPGAPTSSLDIASDGDIGMGSSNPGDELHILRTGTGATRVLVENTNAAAQQVGMRFGNSAGEWQFVNLPGGDFVIREPGSDEFELTKDGDLTISGQLITTGPQCPLATPCDLVFSPDYVVESIEDHSASMWKNQYLPAVGPTSSKRPFNVTEKTGRMLNELEKAHIYIDQLNGRVKELEATLAEVTGALAELTDKN